MFGWVGLLMIATPLLSGGVEYPAYVPSNDESSDHATPSASDRDDLPEHVPGDLAAIDVSTWYEGFSLPFDQTGVDVLYELTVQPNGIPSDCRIRRSSGRPGSDDRVCAHLVSKARFQPYAEDREAGPESYASRFSLRKDPGTRITEDVWTLALFIEEDGTISRCEWVEGGPDGVDPFDVCNRYDWTGQRNENGELVRGHVTLAHRKE